MLTSQLSVSDKCCQCGVVPLKIHATIIFIVYFLFFPSTPSLMTSTTWPSQDNLLCFYNFQLELKELPSLSEQAIVHKFSQEQMQHFASIQDLLASV